MRISFIVPLYHCLPLTQAMLASLQATLPAGLDHEIVFVDDGSTDGTRDWLRTFPADGPIRVVLNDRNLGYAGANNRGAALARGDLLAFLNNDLVLLPGWLDPLLAVFELLGPHRTGLVGNVQLDARTGAIDHTGIVVTLQGKPVHLRTFPPRLARLRRDVWLPPALTGACFVLARPLWRQLGGFDPAYRNGGEDIDLCFRARAAGRLNAVALRSVVRHHVSSSPGRKDRDEENSYRLARRWRHDLVAAADFGARTWCRDYLAAEFDRPVSERWRLSLAALAYLARLRRLPPRPAVVAVERNLDAEFARWAAMFPHLPTATPHP